MQPGTEPDAPRPSVLLDGVSKWFGDVVAVSEVSFVVWPGVTALLGPNGAGKSTVMRMMCGLTPASRGRIEILGRNPRTDREITRQIGIAPQQEGVFERQSAYEFVHLAAVLAGVAGAEQAATRALGIVELDAHEPRALSGYSKGMLQRVKLAQALVADPHVVVLDEPLTGLDPNQRLGMIDLIGRLGAEGRCVIVSSHVLDEVERFGSRILVIAQGRLAAEGDFHAIRNLMDDRPLRYAIRVDKPRELAAALVHHGLVTGVRLTGPASIEVETIDAPALRRQVAAATRYLNTRLWEFTPLDEDLESVFKYLVGS